MIISSNNSCEKPVFLLGMGAQKAATTWIYHYLNDNQIVGFGGVKEWHAWSAFFNPSTSGRFLYLQQTIERYKNLPSSKTRAALNKELHLLQIAIDPHRYKMHFMKLSNGLKVVGDITPNYSRLQREHLELIVRFMSEEFQIKVLFVMRDPVDRCFSMFKHYVRRGLVQDKNVGPIELLRKELQNKRIPGGQLSNYKSTVQVIDSVIPEDNRLYLFYEDLFNEASIRKLTNFLGVDYVLPNFNIRHNEDKTALNLPEELAAETARRLVEIYHFVRFRFNILPERWLDRIRAI